MDEEDLSAGSILKQVNFIAESKLGYFVLPSYLQVAAITVMRCHFSTKSVILHHVAHHVAQQSENSNGKT